MGERTNLSIGKRCGERAAFLDNAANEKFVSLLPDQSTSTFLSLGIFRASAEMKNGPIEVRNLVERFFEVALRAGFDPLTRAPRHVVNWYSLHWRTEKVEK